MSKSSRRVHFYDMEVGVNKQDASPPPMSDIINVLSRCSDDGNASLSINNNTATLLLGGVVVCEETRSAILHMRISDTEAPDTVLSNLHSGARRVIRKDDGEGREHAAHMLVALDAEGGRPDHHLALLERNSGIGRSLAMRLLQAVIREQYKRDKSTFQSPHPLGKRTRDGDLKQIQYRPMLSVTGHPSVSLINDLEAGTITGITLLHSFEEQAVVGAGGWLKKQQSSLRLKPVRQPGDDAWDQIKAAVRVAAGVDYKRARINFVTEAGEPENVLIDVETGNPFFDERYVRSCTITDIDPPLDESSEAVVPHFADKLKAEFVAFRAAEA